MVASDRISAYDFVLATAIPDKGEILTQMSLWWFEQLATWSPHHVRLRPTCPPPCAGRAMVCKRARRCSRSSASPAATSPAPGCWSTDATGKVCGIALPAGLVDGSRLPEPIFTPATKAELGDHDENVSYDAVVGRGRRRDAAAAARADPGRLRPGRGHRPRARHHPGRHQVRVRPRRPDGDASSSATRCSPRTPPASGRPTTGSPGRAQPSYDKQYRARLADLAGVRLGPRLRRGRRRRCPTRSSTRTRGRYVEAYERLTGERF